ncbi:hypothetical protein MNB_SV-8-636 [hydrothermal vent metagenome]|uniref:Uncharacterized protein n=1 Tax=hydrothermal vent metagenome TaxID=652676 RepID=A0A1W1BMH7_9ZZZZ
MISKNIKRRVTVVLGIAVLSFIINGCGGGGGSSSPQASAPTEKEQAPITQQNSKAVSAVATDSIQLGFGAQRTSGGGLFKITGETQTDTAALNLIRNTIRLDKRVEGYCEKGFIDVTNASSTSGTVTFSNCQTNNMIYDGTVTVSTNSSQTSFSATYSDFKITDLTDNAYVYFESMKLSFKKDDYRITELTVAMDGYAEDNGERIDYRNYNFNMNLSTTDMMRITVNGYIKTKCLDGWIGIKTDRTVITSNNDACPIAGKIMVDGQDSSLEMTFNSDHSIDVTVAGETTHYTDCSELESACN